MKIMTDSYKTTEGGTGTFMPPSWGAGEGVWNPGTGRGNGLPRVSGRVRQSPGHLVEASPPPPLQSIPALVLICFLWCVELPVCVCEFSASVSTHSRTELAGTDICQR